MSRILLPLPLLLLTACSAPTAERTNYPQNPAVSDTQGQVFYFPATDPSFIPTDSITAQLEGFPPRALRFASCNLFFFGAPILSNYYLGHDTYRFLWLRSFDRPVLLTLTQQASGATLRTQLLSKPACGPRLTSIQFMPPGISAEEERKLQHEFRKHQADPAVQQARDEANRPPVRVAAEETLRPVRAAQWRRFEQLLQAASFQQLPAHEESYGLDGARWLLEAHQANGYHMVERHSPNKQNSFRRACEYLLELSSARKEERY
ncbi:hypothetical protein ACFPAF_06980 [Hymenobacter endophyticus]|uniref:Uncharacterized protein n=1 Tax=Hymenobacter endophyticus TaxID=3076335 RepID=A0ABU3TFJ0_9BACT|nr:hypothetical protein [Hymenobacter endophyticus]MDU0370129.1 hypothetical protein [Hymenobacter endophyticus]